MAALHTITVTCPACDEPVQCPVILGRTGTSRSPVDGRLLALVDVRIDSQPLRDHECPPDGDPGLAAAAA